jgi:hypothetical protein
MNQNGNSKPGRKESQQKRAWQTFKDKHLKKFPRPGEIIRPNMTNELEDETSSGQVPEDQDGTQTTGGVGFDDEEGENGEFNEFHDAVYGNKSNISDNSHGKETRR